MSVSATAGMPRLYTEDMPIATNVSAPADMSLLYTTSTHIMLLYQLMQTCCYCSLQTCSLSTVYISLLFLLLQACNYCTLNICL